MVQLADEFFSTKNDPDQLDVTPEVMEQLEKIHPATLSEEVEGDGPVVWILLIPTSKHLMLEFLDGGIGERELLRRTPLKVKYDAVYLCSALVLPEYRNQGRAETITMKALQSIQRDHPIQQLFTWPFSQEGERLSHRISDGLNLPLLFRK
ncbi:MAG: hypothetical protein RIQ47_1214 [Bacteroidota bacterium]